MGKHISWKDFYSVGEESLDAQHKQIVAILDDLYHVVHVGGEQAEFKRLLDRLLQYTVAHFEHEEQMMQACGFPDFDNHKAEHDQMRRRTLAYREHLELITAHDLLRFLKEWFTEHVRAQDQCYVPYLSAAARQQRPAIAPVQAIGPIDRLGQTTAG